MKKEVFKSRPKKGFYDGNNLSMQSSYQDKDIKSMMSVLYHFSMEAYCKLL